MAGPSRRGEAGDVTGPSRDGPDAETDPDDRPDREVGAEVAASDADPAAGDVGATDADSDDAASDDAGAAAGSGPRGREVVVPTRVYKRVTVFSTLFAVATVVGGFVVMDEATDRATAPLSEVDPLLALVGLGLIVLGAVTYAFSTRFRAAGMGNAKDESDEPSNDG